MRITKGRCGVGGSAATAFALTGIVSFFLVAFIKSLQRYNSVALGWLGFCFCGFVVCIIIYWRHRKFDLPNRRYELLDGVLRLLERDSSSNDSVSVRLDLQKPDHKTKRSREGKVGPWDVVYFLDPWLDLSGRFLDGTSYHLQGLEKFQNRRKSYRSRSGKRKSKSKSKSALQVTLSLKPKAKKYAEPETISATLKDTVQLPGWCDQKSVGVHKDRLLLTAQTNAEWHGKPLPPQPEGNTPASGPHLVAMMFLSLYQALNQSQTTQK